MKDENPESFEWRSPPTSSFSLHHSSFRRIPMPSPISRHVKNRRSRRLSGESRPVQFATPIGIASVTKSGSTMTVVFNQPVSLKGVPQYTTNLAGVTPTAAAMTAPNTVNVTFSAAVATATSLNIPHEDPAIRNASGGFVSPSTFPVP
jgi:hypothetical protein